jgi:SNF2 family DNA or RNA helicase
MTQELNQSQEQTEPTNPFEPFESEEKALDFLKNYRSYQSGFALRPYQIEDILMAPRANFRVLYNHEVGLGKTAMGAMATHLFEKTPAIILCKTALKYQWFRQILEWTNELSQVIKQPDDSLLPVPFYIVSMDLARKFKPEDWERFNAQTIIIDECQHIKNIEAKRTSALRKLSRNVPHVIALSANAIENRFTEYFPVLNILKPESFRNLDSFIHTWVLWYYDRYSGKMKGDRVKNPKLWREATKSFIIRRLKSDVLKELPPVQKNNHFYNLEKEFGLEYERYTKEFLNYFDNTKDTGFSLFTNILPYLQKMRHLTGRAKVESVVDFTTEFLLSTALENGDSPEIRANQTPRKIVLFVHFKDVAESIAHNLDEWLRDGGYKPCLKYTSNLDAEQRNNLVLEFEKDPERRVMIASLLAAGEGLNLQFCADSVLVDRHWNHSKEEQAVVGRFHRIGQQHDSVNANYMLALGTIDEWLTQIVARKELIVREANDGVAANFDEMSIVLELADKISQMRDSKPWRAAF